MPLLFAPPLFDIPVRNALPEPDSTVKAIATEIQKREAQQREIIATAKQRGRLILSCFRGDNRPGEPATGVEAIAYGWTASDSGSGSENSDTSDENSGTSDENSDSHPGEIEAEANSDVQYVNSTLNPFRVSNEISQYCAALELKKIKQEPDSDSERTTESELDETEPDSVNDQEITSTAYSIDQTGRLKMHEQIHLPADQRIQMYHCDHEGCNYSTEHAGNLKRHKQAHLPADQRPKSSRLHQCDHEGCNYSTDQASNLKRHKQAHLPADQRPKRSRLHQCDHEDCNYSTDQASHLKRHKQTHLPVDQRSKRPNEQECDHEGCNYSTWLAGNLKRHKQTHLPADQRPKKPKRPKLHQCDHEGCNFITDSTSHLKEHKQTHLPADQRSKRRKVQECAHEGCNYRTTMKGNLRRHKQTHLSADQRSKVHRCDHEGCDFRTDREHSLKRHKQIHLFADQNEAEPGVQYVNTTLNPFRAANEISQSCTTLEPIKQEPDSDSEILTESEVDVTEPGSVNHPEIPSPAHSTNQTCRLKMHKQTHLPADQRPKRKAYDQPPSNEKRKKVDKE